MFGGEKPTGFGTPFGASASTTPAFKSTAFGQSTPQAGGLLGQTTIGAGTRTVLFGESGGSAFGTQTAGFNFGATPSSTGGLSPSSTGGLFGQNTTASTGLFGTPAAPTTNTFGFGASGGFGTTTTTASAGGLFGTTAGTGLFGASPAFGQPQSGTAIKYNPQQDQDIMVKNGVTQNFNIKHQCITAMKEYDDKSLEELRFEDYTAGKKGTQAGTAGFGFGAPVVSTAPATGFAFSENNPFGFGTSTGFGTNTSTGTTNLFGQTSLTGGGLFDQNKPVIGNTTQSGFGFGTNTSTGTAGLFGQAQPNKPLFGTTTTTQSSLFGTGTGTFGQPAATSIGFGTAQSELRFEDNTAGKKGTQAGTAGFGFGAPVVSTAPATGFAFSENNPFGFGTSTGFGTNTSTGTANLFGQTSSTGGGLFDQNKPVIGKTTQSGFGFGMNTSTGTAGLFGQAQPNKPLFGTTTTTQSSLFGMGTGTFGQPAATSTGFGTAQSELRFEDYTAGKKRKQAGTAGFGFGAPVVSTAPATGFAFSENNPFGFGTSTGFGTNTSTGTTNLFGQTSSTGGGLFDQNKPVIGNTTTTTQSGLGFGTNTGTGTAGLFGQAQPNKPLFGTTTTTQSSLFGTGISTFGQLAAASNGFVGFGTAQSGGLFGNKPAFGAQSSPPSGFGRFGSNSNTGANLFAEEVSTPYAGFWSNTATTSSGFGGTQPFGAAKPDGFGLTTTSAAPAFTFGGSLNTGTSLFGNTLGKPGGLAGFGQTETAGFGSFGNASLGGTAPTPGGTANQADQTAQLQQTLLAFKLSS